MSSFYKYNVCIYVFFWLGFISVFELVLGLDLGLFLGKVGASFLKKLYIFDVGMY